MKLIKAITLLKSAEQIMFIYPDDTETEDRSGGKKFYPFKINARAVRKNCPFVQYFMQFSPREDADPGVKGYLIYDRKLEPNGWDITGKPELLQQKLDALAKAAALVKEERSNFNHIYYWDYGFPKASYAYQYWNSMSKYVSGERLWYEFRRNECW